jgi:poly(A) polymerase
MTSPRRISIGPERAPWLRGGSLPRLLDVLDRDGEEARVVGGAVRNELLGEPVGDVDVATTALPQEVMRRAEAAGFKPVPTGVEHGTVTVVVDGTPFEVTTLREDVETFGRHARVSFGRDWQHDAERRDFTMNALYAARDGTVYDHVGGLDDLKARRVRFIGDPHKRIAEDYLRILRFFRFHAAYGDGGHPDPAGLSACIAARAGLETHGADACDHERVGTAGGRAGRCSAARKLCQYDQARARAFADARSGAAARCAWRQHQRGCGAATRASPPRQYRARTSCVDGGCVVANRRGDQHA